MGNLLFLCLLVNSFSTGSKVNKIKKKLGLSVPVLSLYLRSTTTILYNYDGVRETPLLLGEVSLEVQDNREDLSVTLSIPSS